MPNLEKSVEENVDALQCGMDGVRLECANALDFNRYLLTNNIQLPPQYIKNINQEIAKADFSDYAPAQKTATFGHLVENAQKKAKNAKQADVLDQKKANTAHIKRKREEAEAANKQEDLNTAHIKRKREEAEAANIIKKANTAQIREQRKEQQKSNAESFEEEKVLHTSNNVLNTLNDNLASKNLTGRAQITAFQEGLNNSQYFLQNPEIQKAFNEKYPNENISAEIINSAIAQIRESKEGALNKYAELEQMTTRLPQKEQQAFTNILQSSKLDFSGKNNAEIFSQLLSRVESSEEISEETKDSIFETTGVVRAKTGKDVKAALADKEKQKQEAEEVLNDETATPEQKEQAQKALEEAEKPIFLAGGLEADINPKNPAQIIVQTKMHGKNAEIIIARESTDEFVCDAINAIMVQDSFADNGFIDVIGTDNLVNSRGDNRWEIHPNFEPVKGKELAHAMLGGVANGMDGEILNATDVDTLNFITKSLRQAGGMGQFEMDQEKGNEILRDFGLLKADGQLNSEKLKTVSKFIRTQWPVFPSRKSILDAAGIEEKSPVFTEETRLV